MPRVPWRTHVAQGNYRLHRRRALWHLAGANDIRVAGNYGVVVGSIDDRAILERYAETGTWCPLETHFFMDFFARAGKGTYLDIGANIGLTTIPVASNPAVVCFAVEPDPTNFAYLQENVRRNCRGGNVRLLQLALLDRAATFELRISPTNKGDLRLRIGSSGCAADDADWPTIEVKAGRLDDIGIDQHIVPPLAAKVVAQGSEFHVLLGGRRILSAAEALVIEFYPYLLSLDEADWNFLYTFLADNFVRAALIPGGQQAELDWQSVATQIECLEQLRRTAATRRDLYFHVFLRK